MENKVLSSQEPPVNFVFSLNPRGCAKRESYMYSLRQAGCSDFLLDFLNGAQLFFQMPSAGRRFSILTLFYKRGNSNPDKGSKFPLPAPPPPQNADNKGVGKRMDQEVYG